MRGSIYGLAVGVLNSHSRANMSVLGQKQILAVRKMMSTLHPKADMCAATKNVG
jgi:hypothetical protein